VTGAGGFIGSWVVQFLQEAGAGVRAHIRPGAQSDSLTAGGVEVIEADLEDAETCRSICCGSEVVLGFAHCDGSAAYKRRHPASLFRINMSITLNLVEAAAQAGVERMLVVSSAEVYSQRVAVPTTEDLAFSAVDTTLADGYSWSKRMSEVAAMLYSSEYGMKLAIARPANVYGPRDRFDPQRGRVIPMFIQHVLNREPIVIWGDGSQIRTFLYVEDFARGALKLTEHFATGQPVNFASSEQVTIRGLAERVADLAGLNADIRCDVSRPAGTACRVLDTTVAEQVLGFRPRVSLGDGLRRTIEYHRLLRSSATAQIAQIS
jgi:nucleoside-diphosphate-sugar epimerase